MATISTEMNWGASYLINDLYRPFLRPNRSERHYVWAGRLGSIMLFAASILVAYFFVQGLRSWLLFINSMVFAFVLPLSWLRFFWWRLNIFGEMTALIAGLPLSYLVWFPLGFHDERIHPFWHGFLLLFGMGVVVIILVTYLFPPESEETLLKFYLRCRPPGLWRPVARHASADVQKSIHDETVADLVDCGLGITFAAAAILFVISLLGGHSLILGAAALSGLVSGALFVRRWTRKGAFRELGAREETGTISHEI
jgi:Na+/proline symporter